MLRSADWTPPDGHEPLILDDWDAIGAFAESLKAGPLSDSGPWTLIDRQVMDQQRVTLTFQN